MYFHVMWWEGMDCSDLPQYMEKNLASLNSVLGNYAI